ncbi:smalltalk protein [Phocaeicola sp.]
MMMKKETWRSILKLIITIASAIAGALGVQGMV